MNSKTCDNCTATAHERRELDTWFQIVGKGNMLNSLKPVVLDACSQPCGVALMERLARSHQGGKAILEGLASAYATPISGEGKA